MLYDPLGAELPGLYHRAAVLASGLLPIEDEKHRLIAYRDVPRTSPSLTPWLWIVTSGPLARTPTSVYQGMRDAYLRYIDTAYWLRDPALMAERRRLLLRGDALFTDVLVEPVVPYDADVPLADAVDEAGVDPGLPNLWVERYWDGSLCLSSDHAATASGRRAAIIAPNADEGETSSSRPERDPARPRRSSCPSSFGSSQRPRGSTRSARARVVVELTSRVAEHAAATCPGRRQYARSSSIRLMRSSRIR